jgi:hypothetical protein
MELYLNIGDKVRVRIHNEVFLTDQNDKGFDAEVVDWDKNALQCTCCTPVVYNGVYTHVSNDTNHINKEYHYKGGKVLRRLKG